MKIGRLSTTFNYSLGSDGRVVCYPSHWATARGSDGRIVAYLGGWTWDEGNDGRRVVRPSLGWTWEEGSDGRKVVRPNGASSNLELIFINAEYLTIFEELKSELSEKELIDYILYIWINVDKDE